jgi:nucleoid-associated protein YgaU
MTRETKIGLLVGLAFIIVIGILLSDHFRSTMEPQQATLMDAGASVRQGANSPGTADPKITIATPDDAPPKAPVATHDELMPHHSPVVPAPSRTTEQDNSQQQADAGQSNPGGQSGSEPMRNNSDRRNDTVAGADGPGDSLTDAARAHGESLEPANLDGRPRGGNDMTSPPTAPAGPSMKAYKAESGDTVSRMAGRLMGGNTKANRDAIIEANPSLQDDPDRVVVGKTYNIPTKAGGGNSVASVDEPQTLVGPTIEQRTAEPGYFYTVRDGDSLWQIANDELGDPSAVDAIKELNLKVLEGPKHDILQPGMKLRLPAKPIASAN